MAYESLFPFLSPERLDSIKIDLYRETEDKLAKHEYLT